MGWRLWRLCCKPSVLSDDDDDDDERAADRRLQGYMQRVADRRTERRSARTDSNRSFQSDDPDADADAHGDGDVLSSPSIESFPKSVKSGLVAQKEKLVKKLRSTRKWRKVFFAVHKLLCAVAIISSLVLGLVGGPAGAITAATVAMSACLSIGPWLKSLWDEYELKLEEQRDALAKMERSASSSERMLRRVQSLEKWVDMVAEFLLHATRDLKERTAAAAAEKEMKKKLGEFMKSIESAEEEVERCRVKLRRAKK